MATVITAPFDKSGNPVDVPFTQAQPVVPLNIATTAQTAVANPATGDLHVETTADVAIFLGQGLAATGAKPFLKGCFEVQTTQNYTLTFLYDYDFNVQLDGGVRGKGIKVTGFRASRAVVQAVAEVFDRNNNLVGDNFVNLYATQAVLKAIKANIKKNNAKISLIVPLNNKLTYYWKLTFSVTILTSAAARPPVYNSVCKCNGTPLVGGAFKGLKLRSVTINPNVFPIQCP